MTNDTLWLSEMIDNYQIIYNEFSNITHDNGNREKPFMVSTNYFAICWNANESVYLCAQLLHTSNISFNWTTTTIHSFSLSLFAFETFQVINNCGREWLEDGEPNRYQI